MEESIELDINNNFHTALQGIDDFFWFYLLSNRALGDPEVQNLIKIKSVNEPEFLSMLKKYNKWVNLQIEIHQLNNKYSTKMNVLNSSIIVGKIMTISVYELLLSSKYHPNIRNLEEFKFLKHIRNGAAHDNKFNFKNKKGEWTIKKDESIKWWDKKINRDLQGKQVFNDFISFSNIFVLANFFSEKLKEIDNKIS
jgi:hypothetical protein